jgi:hypothetical protein
MRTYPSDESDMKDLERLNAPAWMADLLKMNPEYVFWGPREDYMCDKKAGWAAPRFESASEFSWSLDDLNECVNFYFQLDRKSETCIACDQSGYNPATKRIADDFYDFAETGRRWCDRITQDEVEALQKAGRLNAKYDMETKTYSAEPLTAEVVNAANRHRVGRIDFKYNHDAINRIELIRTRAKRLGVYGQCDKCEGFGEVFVEPVAKLNLVLWIIHPRKGAGRAVEVSDLQQEDLPKAFAFLRTAAQRNADRFSKIPG